MRSLLKFVVVIVLCAGLSVPCWSDEVVDSASSERDLAISLTGLPSNLKSIRLMLRAIDLSTGAVKATISDNLSSSVYMSVPSSPILAVASAISLTTPERYQGKTILYTGGTLDLTMERDEANAGATASRGIYSQTPPRRGKAIGYSPDRFTATGTGNDKGLSKGLMDLFVSNMVEQSNCYDNDSDSSYVMVETANPEILADIEAELAHHGDPAFDPETTVESHLIEPTHMGQGTITDNGTTVTVNIQIVDKDGNVVSSVSKTGSSSALFDTIDKATGDLVAQMCKEKEWKEKEWKGMIEYRRIMPTNTSYERPPDFGTGVKTISYVGLNDLRITTQLKENGDVVSNLNWIDDMLYSRVTNGSITCGHHSGTHTTNFTKIEHYVSTVIIRDTLPIVSYNKLSNTTLRMAISVLAEVDAGTRVVTESEHGRIGCEGSIANKDTNSQRTFHFEGKEFRFDIDNLSPTVTKINRTITLDDYTTIFLDLRR